MSVLEDSVSCVSHLAETDTENNDIVNSDSASVLDAETVQNTNTHNSHVEEETVSDSDLLKGLLSDTFCQVCEAVLLFDSQRVSHYEGKKHAQRVRIYLQTKKAERKKQRQKSGYVDPEKFCELCNMVFSSSVVSRSHYMGKIHAKNMRKSNTAPPADVRNTVGSPTPPVPTGHGAPWGEKDQEQKESMVSTPQGVDLGDPSKYCKLCTASFNNPLMAQQHYSGRKHQRNQARQGLLCKLGEESGHVHSLTCPVCCVTLSSIETYQAHIQSTKHHTKEKKMVGVCKSQKKVYDSFQDELADYIQVQRARGLEPRTGQGPEVPVHKTGEEEVKGTAQEEAETRPSAPAPLSHAPLPSAHPPQGNMPFHPRLTPFAFRGTFPVQQQWNQGCTAHPPPLIPGLTGKSLKRGRSPDSYSSSSFSDDSSSSYSSSSSESSSVSSSEDSRERRRHRRKRRDGAWSRREQDDDSVKDTERRRSKKGSRKEREEERGLPRKAKRRRRTSFEEEQGEQGVAEDPERRRRKEKKPRERDSDDHEDVGRKRRADKNNKRHIEGHYGKRWRGEDEREWSKVCVEERVERKEGGGLGKAMMEDHLGVTRPEPEDERAKCKREKKKKTKDKGDSRTEEEKLWDETILGLF